MSITKRFFFVVLLVILAILSLLPWKQWGMTQSFFEKIDKPYVLGLDLQGGVELDYKVDLSAVKPDENGQNNENSIVETLKTIIDKRVQTLGLAEPTIQTLKYGTDTHIIVQIPTESHSNLSDEERIKKQQQDIKNAKEVIGKVVQVEFKEIRGEPTEADYSERKAIAERAKNDFATMNFDTMSQKYASDNDNIFVKTGIGSLPSEIENVKLDNFDANSLPYISEVQEIEMQIPGKGLENMTLTGYTTVKIDEKIGENRYKYSYVLLYSQPSAWKIAQTADGKTLNDKYLLGATAGFTEANQPIVNLQFNDEGKEIFAEITGRLIGQPLAIFVGGELLTSPIVNDVIKDGRAMISGQSSFQESKTLADNINTGLVPAPIYLTSERTIDAKIGANALQQILTAGVIGLFVIIIFLVAMYRVGGFLAGIALVIYAIILVALVKFFGVVLTLSAIAGVILSIGLAIDANILIFERTHEVLKTKVPLTKAINIGFKHSWTAIWDSHITSFMSAFILFAFGVSLIKGFGFMLGIGILLSLFTAMWVSRILILFTAKFIKNPTVLLGYKNK